MKLSQHKNLSFLANLNIFKLSETLMFRSRQDSSFLPDSPSPKHTDTEVTKKIIKRDLLRPKQTYIIILRKLLTLTIEKDEQVQLGRSSRKEILFQEIILCFSVLSSRQTVMLILCMESSSQSFKTAGEFYEKLRS